MKNRAHRSSSSFPRRIALAQWLNAPRGFRISGGKTASRGELVWRNVARDSIRFATSFFFGGCVALVGRFFGIRSESLSCLERLDCISQYCDLVIHSFLLFFFFFLYCGW